MIRPFIRMILLTTSVRHAIILFAARDVRARGHLGTLNIGPKGGSCFYGATARGEVSAVRLIPACDLAKLFVPLSSFHVYCVQFLLRTGRQRRDASYFRRTRLSERVLSVPFPEASPELLAPDIRQMVYDHLPRFEDARGACELFMNYSSYMFVVLVLDDLFLILTDVSDRTSSLTREELLHILETVYQNKCVPFCSAWYASIVEVSCRSADPEPITHHLSLLFIVLALSRLLYGEDNYTVDSQDYFVLSRVALTLDSPMTTTTVTAVQTIVRGLLTVTYEALSNTGLHG
jgi:hypothetical protein